MDDTFKYSVLRYRPSYFLDERVNIGLMLFFQESKRLIFIYPKRLGRLKQLYPNTNLYKIKNYLKIIYFKTNSLSGNMFLNEFTDKFISNEFLLPNSNSLFFSKISTGNYNDQQQIIDHYSSKFFDSYSIRKSVSRHDEAYIVNRFSSHLNNSANENTALFKKDFKVKNEILETNFDFGWQNGTFNLVKSISFDLSDSSNINSKSFRWFGELSNLSSVLPKKDVKLDLLVSKPQDEALFKYYDRALVVLNNIPLTNSVIEESKMSNYIDNALETVKPISSSLDFIS